jgi:hypothetical protein
MRTQEAVRPIQGSGGKISRYAMSLLLLNEPPYHRPHRFLAIGAIARRRQIVDRTGPVSRSAASRWSSAEARAQGSITGGLGDSWTRAPSPRTQRPERAADSPRAKSDCQSNNCDGITVRRHLQWSFATQSDWLATRRMIMHRERDRNLSPLRLVVVRSEHLLAR